jgi:hypothetical protein
MVFDVTLYLLLLSDHKWKHKPKSFYCLPETMVNEKLHSFHLHFFILLPREQLRRFCRQMVSCLGTRNQALVDLTSVFQTIQSGAIQTV